MHEHGYQIDRVAESLPCPRCGCMTDSLKYYAFWRWFLLLPPIHWTKPESIRMCAPCIRRHVLKRAGFLILTAHVFWPLCVLPWALTILAMSLSRGHSYQFEFEPDYLYHGGESDWRAVLGG